MSLRQSTDSSPPSARWRLQSSPRASSTPGRSSPRMIDYPATPTSPPTLRANWPVDEATAGGVTPTYQWFRGAAAIVGATHQTVLDDIRGLQPAAVGARHRVEVELHAADQDDDADELLRHAVDRGPGDLRPRRTRSGSLGRGANLYRRGVGGDPDAHVPVVPQRGGHSGSDRVDIPPGGPGRSRQDHLGPRDGGVRRVRSGGRHEFGDAATRRYLLQRRRRAGECPW